ncbi:hypothetical protein AC578_7104 [Pseudocercospora eumusae]|uniref:Ubiquitin-like domain-containing protein n=1 Tax=Pseudocercospora eumusae TaxID=321146 RepID=A0A139HWG4_9PEZI|nr:hypothetical protein AC578_7104 [Pseudocercospora eumusae]
MPPPRLNIADRHGSPQYTSIGQTQPDGATAAERKITRWVEDSSQRQWGGPPRRMTEWEYGPDRRPWGAPANSWVFEQGRKDVRARQGSDQAISDWIARIQDAHSMQSPTGSGEAPNSHAGWNNAGWEASTSLNDRWDKTSQALSRFGYHPLSHQSEHEDQWNGWDGKTKHSRAEAQKERDGWGAESVCRENSGRDKKSAWAEASGCENDGWGATVRSQDKFSGSGRAKDNWDDDIAWPTAMKSQEYNSSSGYLLTPRKSTKPSFKAPMTGWTATTHRQNEEVRELRRQLAEEKRKNAELGRRLYTLENEQIDPGSVYGIAQEGDHDTQTTPFQWLVEDPAPPSTPLPPTIKPKPARKVAPIFDSPPPRPPNATLDSIDSSLPSYRTGKNLDSNTLAYEAKTQYDRYSGIIRDRVLGTRPVFFTMSQSATFGDVLRSWKKRRGIKNDALILYYRGRGCVVPLDSTVSMEGIVARHIELDVIAWEMHDGW